MPNGFGPPPIFMPEDFNSKSGLTRTAKVGRVPSSIPQRAIVSSSRSDSTLTMTFAATACMSSSSVFPGPAKLIRSAATPASSAMRSSPADATSSPSTRRARCCTTAGIGFALIA